MGSTRLDNKWTGNKDVSFHGVYDRPEYAAIFGEFETITAGGMSLLCRVTQTGFVSGPGAGFGGVVFSAWHVHHPTLDGLTTALKEVVIAARQQAPNCRSITVRLAADEYYPMPLSQSLHAAFALSGWSRAGDVTHIITPGTFCPCDMTARNVRKADHRCLRIDRLEPDVCFEWLSAIKAQKGYRFDYMRARFVKQFETFQDACQCYGVLDPDGNVLAAIFEVETGDGVLFVNWDQNSAGRENAATDHLLFHRLERRFADGHRFVDLGTMTLDGHMNWGLARHKANFGGYGALRHNYRFECNT